ncbi:uncharacterized protein LOC134203076 [Armigeres subalbatus]|uniref:uncharacterized protein LOC134203076 n=1 Tax=Armigeres subalbatus TaxID=124917 RepID=UPI002ED0DE17
MKNQHLSIKPAAKTVVTELQFFWEIYRIPLMQHYNAVVKLLKLFNKMRAIIKKSSHAGDKQKEQESNFINNLDRLFDIARRNALNLIKNDKDKQFLILQREVGRPGSAFARVKKGKIEEEPTTEPEPSLESQSATSVFTIDGGDEKPSTSRAFSERSKSKIMTPILAATLDRIGLSDRNAMYVISAVLTSAGLNLGTDKVERLPVLVSSGANVQLLGVPKLSSGTGERQANESSVVVIVVVLVRIMMSFMRLALKPRSGREPLMRQLRLLVVERRPSAGTGHSTTRLQRRLRCQ